MIKNRVGFIGGGNMARAIAGGLLRGGMLATDIFIAEPLESQRERLRKELYGVQVSGDNDQIASQCEVLLFAVKPQILKPVCTALASTAQGTKPLVISIAAGPKVDDIDAWLGGGLRVVRVMPNQPALIDQGVSALFANALADDLSRQLAETIMSAVGEVVWVKEEPDIDSVTALSGTGPAYVYLLIDVMIEAAIEFGLSEETARVLAVQTARGASALAAAESESMASMISRVRSPGGTTQAAFEYLDSVDVRGIFSNAIRAARSRAEELGNVS